MKQQLDSWQIDLLNVNRKTIMSNKNKVITRAERQELMAARNQKLDNHINKGVEDYVQSTYNDSKEARKTARWYEAGEALVEARLKGQYDADLEFNEEFNEWAAKEQEKFNAQLDADEQKLLEAEDDIVDVPFTVMSLPTSRRTSKLISSSSTRLISSGSTPQLESSLPSKVVQEEDDVFTDNTLPPLD